jgi:HEAT repeat protein
VEIGPGRVVRCRDIEVLLVNGQELPPEDRPDTIDIGPVKGIPIIHDDDPRFEKDRAAWSAARKRAQAMITADELLAGLQDADWRVRHDVVDRLIARAAADPRTPPALLRALAKDPSWQVRNAVAMRLHEFDPAVVAPALERALDDTESKVRWSARYSLQRLR